MNTMIGIKLLRDGAEIPCIKTKGSVGADLVCPEDVFIKPFHQIGHGTLVPLGFSLQIPNGYAVYLYLRSSTGLNTPLRLSNAVGVVDADYTGEVGLLLDNLSNQTIHIAKGTALAQMILKKQDKYEFKLMCPVYGEKKVPTTPTLEHRTGGFGSTTTTTSPTVAKKTRTRRKRNVNSRKD